MRSRIPGIRAAAYAAIWAMREDKLHAVLDFIDMRAEGRTLTRAERLARGIQAQAGGRSMYQSVGSVAVIPLRGVIAHHAGMEMDISGGTSTVAFGRALEDAINAQEVASIVIDCDSPGGTVTGVPELAAMIYAARGTKPIVGAVNAQCASAAYYLLSQCDEISIMPSGEAGDIGVMCIRTDVSAAEAKDGISRTLIKAGKYKGEGNPIFAPTDAELTARAAQVLEVYNDFTAAVARGRKVSVSDVVNGMGEGRSLLAKQAVAAGLADRIETVGQTIGRLGGNRVVLGGPRRAFAARNANRTLDAARIVAGDLHAEQPIEDCPDCGAPMDMQDDVLTCPECGYTAPDDTTDDSATAATASAVARSAIDGRTVAITAAQPITAEVIPIAAGAAPPGSTPPPITPTISQEHTVPDLPTPTLAELQAQARLEAAQRVNDITALCTAHNITATAAAEFISSDRTVAQVGLAIAEQHRTARAANPAIRVGADLAADRPFTSLGENLKAIAQHFDRNLGEPDKRLYAAVTTGGASANVGSDGGFLIQKEFATELLESTIEQGNLLGEADSHEVGPNADGLEVVYLDETSRATGSRWGGVQVYRAQEADAATMKKPKLGKWEVRLEDIIGAATMTERQLQDAPSIQNVFETGFMAEFQFVAENEMVRGNGSGQMLGVLNAGCTVSVAKVSSQDPDSLIAENIGSMWKCVHPRSRLKGAWYYNVELEDQLDRLQIGTGTSAQLVYMPPGGISGKPYGTIKGRPVIPIEYASGAGDVGDFFFADWSRYKVITKGGLQSENSIHVRFLNNERTFRWITRINGAPKDKLPITPFKATDSALKLSPFVTLAAR